MKHFLGAAVLVLWTAGASRAADVPVTADITTSTTWTANNVYKLMAQIYVTNQATLTIQAGTVIASDTGLGGSLAVTRGAKIFVQGTQSNPVIMTSQADKATWVGGNPKTGTWREAANEWGNLTIMGNAYISEDAIAGNSQTFGNNVADMEGLDRGPATDRYGGTNDDDDSGTITYLSLRYGGKRISLNNELNGLSLGGIGRETDIHHVEIMNNVDDGIEVWGGTVNLKYVSIWNVGDDSVDLDQGYRGKIQHVLIVQGHSLNAAQGSGVGDNCFETDGAEDSYYQPVTTTTVYNATVIGQPNQTLSLAGDHATAWRDNARVQYRNCIFMHIGERVVSFDNVDGDGGDGYGASGGMPLTPTLSWANTWLTDYNAVPAHPNDPPAPRSTWYPVQTGGKLAAITDSVFFGNAHAAAYTEANNRGVFAMANNNVQEPAGMPIRAITRGPVVQRGPAPGPWFMEPVTFLDPRPANTALTSVAWAPRDGFFSSAHYRGAFAPGNNWLCDWTASQAFSFTSGPAGPVFDPWCDLGFALAGVTGDPVFAGTGTLAPNTPFDLTLSNAAPNSIAFFGIGLSRLDVPLLGTILVPNPTIALLTLPTDGTGQIVLAGNWPPGQPSGITFYFQYFIIDAAGPFGLSASNAVSMTTP